MTDIDAIAIAAFISGGSVGVVIGLLWEHHGWVKECTKRKLVKYDSKTGKLQWVCDRTAAP